MPTLAVKHGRERPPSWPRVLTLPEILGEEPLRRAAREHLGLEELPDLDASGGAHVEIDVGTPLQVPLGSPHRLSPLPLAPRRLLGATVRPDVEGVVDVRVVRVAPCLESQSCAEPPSLRDPPVDVCPSLAFIFVYSFAGFDVPPRTPCCGARRVLSASTPPMPHLCRSAPQTPLRSRTWGPESSPACSPFPSFSPWR